MSGGSTLALLAARAETAPEEPWVFYRWGWGWRWRSWARVADHVHRCLVEIQEADLAPGSRIGFAGWDRPDDLAVGMAIRAAGHVAVIVRDGEPTPPADLAAWARVSEEGELFDLDEVGLIALGLGFKESSDRDRHGNEFRYWAPVWFELPDGSTGRTESSDVFLVTEPVDAQELRERE